MQTESEGRKATPEDVEAAWSTRDLALHFGVPIQTVAKAAKRGSIPGCAKVLGRYVFDREESLKWQPAAVTVTGSELAAGPQGQFKKGNAFGVGNRGGRPSRAIELKFMSTLTSTVSADNWKGIIEKAISQALEGDWRARAWLSNYLMGTPIQRVQAELDVTGHTEFADGERAAAVTALLAMVRARVEAEREAKTVDGELTDATG